VTRGSRSGRARHRRPELIACTRASLETLGSHQTDLGMIHLNVDTRTGDVTTENAGAVDANLWFILAHDAYRQHVGDLDFARELAASARRQPCGSATRT
jgi:hypothetical protein